MLQYRGFAIATACLLVGCAGGEKLIEVKGKVLVGDQPVGKGQGFVTFHPNAAKGNKWLEESVGAIQPDGGLSHHVGDLTVLALWGLFGLYFAIRGFSWDQRRA